MQIQSPELLNKLAEWQRKAADGSISLDEMREAIKALRANRMAAGEAAAKSRASGKKGATKAPLASPTEMLDLLKGL